jgi:hypothetical protein
MHTRRFGAMLLATGAVVGVAAVVGLVVGFEPSRLPRALLDIAVYKLTFAAAAGLLAAGAIVRRHGNRASGDEAGPVDSRPIEVEKPLLREAQPDDFAAKRDQSVESRVPRDQ